MQNYGGDENGMGHGRKMDVGTEAVPSEKKAIKSAEQTRSVRCTGPIFESQAPPSFRVGDCWRESGNVASPPSTQAINA
jgi:hypothetical protein